MLRDAHVRRLMLLELANQPMYTPYLSVLEQLDELNGSTILKVEHALLSEQNQFLNLKDSWIRNEIIGLYFEPNHPEPSIVRDIFSLSYMKSFIAFNNSVKSLDPNLLHEWRKRLKDVQYQFELLYGSLSFDIQTHYLKIQDLCTLLGELNDWDMMNQWITDNRDKLTLKNSQQSLFFDVVIKRHESLLDNAITAGHELYKFNPNRFKEKLI